MDLIILKDGLYSLYPLNIEFKDVMECLAYGDILREKLSDYAEDINRWVMKDGKGYFFGYYCH